MRVYRMIRRGEFPRPIRIGIRAARWRADEVEAWIDGRERATAENFDLNAA